MDTSPSGSEGLLSQEEQALLQRVSRSKVWRLIMDALVAEREALFSGHSTLPGLTGQPATNESLWKVQGAILLVQYLLQNGPAFVVWYQRFKEAQEDTKKAKPKMPEREYNPTALNEPPDFDL